MEKNELKAVKREVKSRGDMRILREKGFVPAVLYGHGITPISMAVEAKPFNKLLLSAGRNVLITLQMEGSTENAVVKAMQRDVIKRNPIHIDFQRVVMSEKIEVSVPVHIVGEAPGVKIHEGILEHLLRELRVRCLPSNIPVSINVDVGMLDIGDSITVEKLPVMEGLEFLNEKGQIIVNVVPPTAEEEVVAVPGAPAAPGATGTEPEVIAKGKKDEEGAVAAGADAKGDAKKPDAKAESKPEAKKPDAKK